MLTDPWKPLVQKIAPELSSEDFSCVRVPQQQKQEMEQEQDQEQEQEHEEQQAEEDVEKEFA